jgi:hypothetical protein
LADFLNYRIDYNSQTVEKVVKKIFFSAPKASKSGDRQVLVSRQWRYSGGRSTYYYFGALKNIFEVKTSLGALHTFYSRAVN